MKRPYFLAVVPDPTWLVECCTLEEARSGSYACTLTVVPQKTGICPVCGKDIFQDSKTGGDHRI